MPNNPLDRPHDGFPGKGEVTDAHGRAALLLVESLIHALKSRAILTLREAIDIIESAAEVERDIMESGDQGAAIPTLLLAPIAASLRIDLRD